MIKFRIPRKTAKVYIQSGPEPDTFTVFCNLNESENWENVVKIPFKEGTAKVFLDEENKREPIWKKYVIPVIPFATAIVKNLSCV